MEVSLGIFGQSAKLINVCHSAIVVKLPSLLPNVPLLHYKQGKMKRVSYGTA